MELPSGTVTFLFTDIEGSTRLWQQFPDDMPVSLAQHHALLTRAIEENSGYVFQVVGDAFCAAFDSAGDGLKAALAAQQALAAAPWGITGTIRVRMALHSGTVEVKAGEYKSGEYQSGITLSRSARLLSAGHGEQILLSAATRELLHDRLPPGVSLLDLGIHRLKDLQQPEHLYQVLAQSLRRDFPPLKTLDLRASNLPTQLTRFIGRENELVEIAAAIKATHLLTLLGPGGCGKTRLAIEIGQNQLENFPDGAWLVDYSPVNDAHLVAEITARALGLLPHGGQAVEAVLIDYLSSHQLLLILDNCEHLAEEISRLAHLILRSSQPRLRILATSQVPLGITGEMQWLVPPLPVPGPSTASQDLDTLLAYDVVRLFTDRAAYSKPSFQLTEQNALAVVEICRRLDGIPLAIELAAARVKLLSPGQIASRLDDRFNLLSGSRLETATRHQTLQAAIEWSYHLLTPQEQVLLCRLAVFTGSFSLEVVEGVCSDETVPSSLILDLLSEFVDRSLISILYSDESEVRYRLLESIRLFLNARLAEPERSYLRHRMLSFYESLARQADQQIHGPDQARWMDRLDAELPNLRAVLEWSVHFVPPDPRLLACLHIAGGIAWFLRMRTNVQEMLSLYERILVQSDACEETDWVEARAYGYYSLGRIQWMVGSIQRAKQCQETSRNLFSQLDEKGVIGFALATSHMTMCMDWPEIDQSVAYAREAIDLLKSRGHTWGAAEATFHLAIFLDAQSEYDQAEKLFREAMSAFHAYGDLLYFAFSNINLSRLYLMKGLRSKDQEDPRQAHQHLHYALSLMQTAQRKMMEIGFLHGTGLTYGEMGRIYLALDQMDEAERMFLLSLPYQERAGLYLPIFFARYNIFHIHLVNQEDAEAIQQMQRLLSDHHLNTGYSLACCLCGLSILCATRDPRLSAQLTGKASSVFEELHELLPPEIAPFYEVHWRSTRQLLGEAVYKQALASGSASSIEPLLLEVHKLFPGLPPALLIEKQAPGIPQPVTARPS